MVQAIRAFIFGALVASHSALAAPIEVTLDQSHRGYRNTGTLVLRDPFSNEVIGRYRMVTGGFGRGSAPFGRYVVGEFLDDSHGPRWNIHAPGERDGEVWDPKVNDTRTEIQLHRLNSDAGTLGCVGIVATKQQWRAFVDKVHYITGVLGRASFSVGKETIELAVVGVTI